MTTKKVIKKKANKKVSVGGRRVGIPPLVNTTAEVWLIGDTPLIQHRWEYKALDDLMRKHAGIPVRKRLKHPIENFWQSMYRIRRPKGEPDRYAVPSGAFKTAAVGACRYTKKAMAMTQAKGAFQVQGSHSRVYGLPRMREDVVRLQGKTTDLRYRGEFPEWAAKIEVRFNENVFSLTQIIDLINLAGFHQGVGEMRPERSHSNGMFHVGTKDEAEHYQKEYGDVEFGDYQGELLYEDLLPPYDPVTEKILDGSMPMAAE
jgi:hypothetical protein